ncbi:MAG: ERCC4 domain-containing protein [Lachnospiraceae bacterium]|nr:ERCC4 domain-containing protein [Lachnospiraceae bacterium]
MIIIEDTRQQKEKHEIKHKHFEADGVEIIRCKLPFGDYAPPPKVAIDTKKGLEEICGNICGGAAEHQRFKRECIAAKRAGCKLYILIENSDGITDINMVHKWKNPRTNIYPNCAQGSQLEKAMKTMSERYNVTFLFCSYENSAKIIERILTDV